MNNRNDIVVLAVLVGLAVVGLIVLTALHDTAPDVLTYVILAGVGALAGVALPSHGTTATAPAVLPPAVPADPAPVGQPLPPTVPPGV